MRTFLIQLLIGSCCFHVSQAQIDSVVWPLPIVNVLEEHPTVMHYSLYSDQDSSDSPLAPLYFSTSDLLQFSSGTYLRDYGNQSLSTLSIRGGSSQQTEILWNGAGISNPMLGLGDVSILPLQIFSDVSIQSLQQNGLYNPIGGSLSLQTELKDSSFYSIGLSGGQFGHLKGMAKGQYNFSDRLQVGIQLYSLLEQQNFPYQEEHTSVLLPEDQPHATIGQNGVLGQLYYKVSDVHTLSSSLWLQGGRREIPPLITQSKSEAVQADSFYRAQFEWDAQWNTYDHRLLITKRDENNTYVDPLNGIDNQNEFESLQIQSEHQYEPGQNWNLRYGLSYEHILANTKNYIEEQTSDLWLAFVNPIYSFPNWPLQLDLSLRYSQQDDHIAPPGGHAALKWILQDQSISFSFHQANRFPSLNDLYWRPGGNPDLQPEFSQQFNLAYNFQNRWRAFTFKQQFNAFYKKVDNWILWAPIDQFLWAPHNLIEVTSTGMEYALSLSYRLTEKQQLNFEGNFLYQYVRNTDGPNTPLAQRDRNLIYMPATKANGSLTYQIDNFKISYLHHFRSKIYTRPNLSTFLDPLQLGQIRLAYSFKAWGHLIQTYVQGYNIWDQTYFFQPNRPAPGSYWRLGLFIQNQ